MSLVALLRDASHAGTMMIALKKIGPKKVAIRNHFERTLSRYSRLMIAQSLAMSAHPFLDSSRADLLQEDLVQRRLDHLESLHRRARIDNPLEQRLRIGAWRHLDLEKTVRVIGAPNQRVVAQNGRYPRCPVSLESERDVPLAVFLLHVSDIAVEHFLAARDDAHRIAEPLGVVH